MDAATSRADPNEVRRVVVGFDGSASAGAALSWAVEEARLHDAPLEVWAGVDAPEAAEVRASFEQFVTGTSVEFHTASQDGHGGVAAVLCQVRDPSDLLVVGSRVAIRFLVCCWVRSARPASPTRRARSLLSARVRHDRVRTIA